jgi:hypothetical protein
MSEALFRSKAPWVMNMLMQDFPLGTDDAAAIVGNLGHESGGFALMQELKPIVPGSRGGYGWSQWTASRRRDFEAYCARNGLDPASDVANYKFLFVELSGSEKGAIAKTVGADGLDAKVIAFENAFLRAGIKHYESRQRWAQIALDAHGRNPHAAPPPGILYEQAEPIIVAQPAPIGHNGGPPLDPVHPRNPKPSPVEQSAKAVGAGKWAAIAGALWTAVVSVDVLPPAFTTPEFVAAVTAMITAVAGAVGSYRAPKNAEPN